MSLQRPRVIGCCCFKCVGTANVGIVERCNKFQTIANPGFNFVCWPFDAIAGGISLRLQQMNVRCQTKTKDNVFLSIVVSVQFEADPELVYDAYYKLTDPERQINSYVFDSIRSIVPKLELDQVFVAKKEIAADVKSHLGETMQKYGYNLFEALIVDIDPDQKVKDAMNEINAARRLKEAQKEKAEAQKITLVKAAEADADAKYLSGQGVAKQRRAIVDGLRSSVDEFAGSVEGTTPQDVMHLLLLTQYFDMLNDVGKMPGSRMFMPHAPSAVGDLKEQLASFAAKGVAASSAAAR
eukprot:CAMPEP_0206394516 /NCGR_PEP_ID=MMETSP0294-20121207/21439_1 /ASSEMBLY_ACC=CAM_ASM_000327 /TAXON_ID=39354 /ORGANISM="Heterosigma akashiwo, Strain CCMP2393" /LENGTH=295 /DNA_ID=CAMNT_0053848477 /DNA_START=487 /DNA_END=1372 /DNA_ORIENTATION=-